MARLIMLVPALAFACVPVKAQQPGERMRLDLNNGEQYIGTVIAHSEGRVTLQLDRERPVSYDAISSAYVGIEIQSRRNRGALIGAMPIVIVYPKFWTVV